MKYFFIVFLLVAFTLSGLAQEKEIQQILKSQVRCWNVGDLDCFMNAYWKSDSLLFIGKNGVTRGWYQTYNNYYQNYPADAMGILNFDIVEMRSINENAFFVVGKWNLIRQTGDVQGHFSLIFKRIEGKWLITADHSS
jgi:hypothetical protein